MSDQTPRIHNKESSLPQIFCHDNPCRDSPLNGVPDHKNTTVLFNSNNIFSALEQEEDADVTEERDDEMSHSRCECCYDHEEGRDQVDDMKDDQTFVRQSCTELESSPSEVSKCDSTVSGASQKNSLIHIKRARPVHDDEEDDDVLSYEDVFFRKRVKCFSPPNENVTELFWTQRVD